MKTNLATLFAAACFGAAPSHAQFLYDDFEDGIISPALWSVALPFGHSQIVESGGLLTTTGRGTLATAAGFAAPLVISGTVTLNHYWENFGIVLRTDLSQHNPYWERKGIAIGFLNAYDVNLYGVPGISIAEHTPSGATTLATNGFTLAHGQPYQFAIIDTGDRVTVAVNGVERLSAATTYAAGDRIAFLSREFAETSSSLSYVSIVPEPGGGWLVGLGLARFVWRRRRPQS